MKVRQATSEDVPSLVALFQELDRMQADWRVFTPRPGFYDEVGAKYGEALNNPDALVLVERPLPLLVLAHSVVDGERVFRFKRAGAT